MFELRITVGKIDYEKTMMTLFPIALNTCKGIQNPNLLIRLFLELGEDAMPVLLAIMEKLSDAAKQELLCQCMNGYHRELTDKLNTYLQADNWGRNFVVQNLYMAQTNEGVEFIGENVSVDYKTLLESEAVCSKVDEMATALYGSGKIMKIFTRHAGSALKLVAETAPGEIEKLGLRLLQREDIKDKLMYLAQEAIEKKKLVLELKTLFLAPVSGDSVVWDNKADSGILKLSPALEIELIRALSEYLKNNIR